MDKKHENRNTMYEAVDQFFIEKKPAGPMITALADEITALHNVVASIKSKDEELIAAVKGGKTEAKASARDSMLNLLYRIIANLRSIARKTGDSALQDLTDISDSRVAMKRDTEQRDFANAILKAAVANASKLTAYGVDDAMLADLKSRIDTFGGMIGSREAGSSEASTIRQALYGLFVQADAILDDMDDTMRSYESTDPDFYNEYNLLRPVKATGIRHKHPPQPTTKPQAAGTK
ncbi:MAG TPA: hypothetical protein VLX91_07950 [Candidatus Acidoferrales bacterium]|nr:hypothetical protein [Candidatus Acidoferrales bacterium]